MSQVISECDALISEATAVVDTPLFKLDLENIMSTSGCWPSIGQKNVQQEFEDQGKPYRHLCKIREGLKDELIKKQEASIDLDKDFSNQSKASKDQESLLERLKVENSNKESALKAMETKVQAKGTQLDDMKVQLEEYSEKIKKNLGLDVVVLKGETPRFLVSFQNLAGGEKCTCELGLNPDTNVYKIGKVHPKIDDQEFIDKLESDLNESNDLSGFAVVLRKKFKTLCEG